MSEVDIQVDHKNDFLVLAFTGKLDALSSPAAEKKVFDFIESGNPRIIFDFKNVNYLSSAGLRMLFSVSKKLKGLSGRVVLSDVQQEVMNVLALSGFDHILEIAPSLDEAKKKLS